jgi:diguanylate cyclase (GGDEF)-like protein/PAS domain S-box-containing protein
MSLRWRVAYVVWGVLFVLFAIFFVTRRLLVRDFLSLEELDLSKNAERVLDLVENEKQTLERTLVDWSFWEDTYRFVGGAYPEYVTTNCTDDVFSNLRLHFMGFFREDGTLFFGRREDVGLPLPSFPPEIFSLLDPQNLQDVKSGFFKTPAGVFMVAFSRILKSSLSGPPRGFLLFGRLVDEEFIGRLEELSGFPLRFEETGGVPEEVMQVEELSPREKGVTLFFPYLSGNGALKLSFLYERVVFLKAQESLRVFSLHLFGGSALLFLLLFLFMGRTVVQRILVVASFLEDVRVKRDFALRLSPSGKDEVGTLQEAVNDLLASVEKAQEDLRESETRFRELFERVPVGVYRARFGGEIALANSRMVELFGCGDLRELRERGLGFFRKDALFTLEYFERLLKEQGEVRGLVSTWVRRDGVLLFLRESARLVGEEFYEGTLEDVTGEVLAREDLKKSEMYYRILLEYSSDGVVVLDREGRVRFATSSIENVTGFKPEEIQGTLAFAFVHPKDVRLVKRAFLGGKEGVVRRAEFRLRHRDGSFKVVEAVGRALLEHSLVQGVVVTVRDITERKKVEEAIRYASFRDALTGLYNRAYFEEELARLSGTRFLPLSVIVGDLNGLKIINDVFGHGEGDKVLKLVAKVFREVCRQSDVVARWGGDEFAVILPRADVSVVVDVCERVRKRLGEEKFPLPVSIALGWATEESSPADPEGLVREAEEKMYWVKLSERETMYQDILKTLEEALKEVRGELYLSRMERLVSSFGKRLHLSQEGENHLVLLARFADVGVIALAWRGGESNLEEEDFIRRHTESGYFIASNIPLLSPLAEAILSHHERWDGKGLPRGLKGEEIPFLSRVVALCEAFLSRPYEEALNFVRSQSGCIFDPFLALEFVDFVRRDFAENGAEWMSR